MISGVCLHSIYGLLNILIYPRLESYASAFSIKSGTQDLDTTIFLRLGAATHEQPPPARESQAFENHSAVGRPLCHAIARDWLSHVGRRALVSALNRRKTGVSRSLTLFLMRKLDVYRSNLRLFRMLGARRLCYDYK